MRRLLAIGGCVVLGGAFGAFAFRSAPSAAATAPKPGLLFNIGGTSGNVHMATARGALPTFIFIVNNSATTVTGIHLLVHLGGQKILAAGVKATPPFSKPVKQVKSGSNVTFILPPLKPKVSLTFTTRAALLAPKLGRFCPGYALFTAPGWNTTKQAITCFTITK